MQFSFNFWNSNSSHRSHENYESRILPFSLVLYLMWDFYFYYRKWIGIFHVQIIHIQLQFGHKVIQVLLAIMYA